jgi:hypothetical protein
MAENLKPLPIGNIAVKSVASNRGLEGEVEATPQSGRRFYPYIPVERDDPW